MSIFALIDGNNFFVSCQRVFEPKLEGHPVVVLSNNDGCIIARSNEAKELGIKMGEPYFKAKSVLEFNNVKVFSANLELYCDMSDRMMKILKSYSPKIEEYSIDEAFLDFSDVKTKELIKIGSDIKDALKRGLGLPVCVGFGPTKNLSKIANRFAKTYEELKGIYYFDPQKSNASLGLVDIEDVWGVGRAYAKELKSQGIKTAQDMISVPPGFIKRKLTIVGARIHQELKGISCIPLETKKQEKQSITVSRSLRAATASKQDLREAIATHAVRGCEKLRSKGLVAKELTIFITTTRFTKGKQYEKSSRTSLIEPTNCTGPFLSPAMEMIEDIFKTGYHYKKAGIVFSKICRENMVSRDLFFEGHKEPPALLQAMDLLNQRYGNKTILYGATGLDRTWQQIPSAQSPKYTTRIKEILMVE